MRDGGGWWTRGRRVAVGAVVALVLASPGTGGVAVAAPPPNPLPWTRTYVGDVVLTTDELFQELFDACRTDVDRGLRDNGVAGAPVLAVVGDSVQVQTRLPAMGDTAFRWVYSAHCGEQYRSVIDSGRLDDAVSVRPDVLIDGIGSNDLSYFFHYDAARLPGAVAAFGEFLDRTDAVPCRVIINLPEQVSDPLVASLHHQMNEVFRQAAATRPGVHLADWNLLTAVAPGLRYDDQHLTHAGIDARINLGLATARQCLVPDTPTGLDAVAGNGTATAWWNPLPAPEGITGYRVEVSDGRTVTTSAPTVNIGGLQNGVPVSFRVSALNVAGVGDPTAWSAPVVPAPAGARFHPLAPVRVIDTRDGTGGRSGALGPGGSFTVALAATVPALAGASAVMLNVTATGATTDSFVTVWPGGQSRPLTSNLNPSPALGAAPAMVTSRVGPGASVSLYNNSGSVHLVADVVGWYDQPGSGTGALYVPGGPSRVLDTRDGTGGKQGPFGAAASYTLPLPGVPAGATAAVLNVTSVNTTHDSFVTLWPSGQPRPRASNANPATGRVRANLTAVAVGAAGAVDVFNNSASTDLVIDLVGWYTPLGAATGGAAYFPLSPERVFDTRDGTGGVQGPVANAAPTVAVFPGRGALPASATAVSAVDANVTVVHPTAAGHTTVWPGGPTPVASTLNYVAAEVVPNRDLIAIDPASGAADLWSVAPSVDYVIDVSGWFGPLQLTALQWRARAAGAAPPLPPSR